MIFENADCMDVMARYADKHFDLAIVDPPYGKRPTRGINGFGVSDKINFQPKDDKWDIRPDKKYFDALFRVSKNQIIWGCNYFIDYLYPTNCLIIWDKQTGKNPYADAEIAWTNYTSVTKIYSQLWLGSHCKDIGGLIHPTQKPVALYKWLLKNYAKEGDMILDTHVGSASSLIAFEDCGFDYVACELDADYFASACARIKDFRADQKLPL